MSNTSALSAGAPSAPPGAALASPKPGARPRLDSLDWLRGLVMVLMVLDHTRDFLAAGSFNPRDLHNTALFLTRWITHFCAPTFIFLAGISAHLYASRGRTRAQLTRFLLTRGLWLIFLEIIIIRFAWTFSFRIEIIVLQVIWAIGVSFLVLAALVQLPRWLIAAFAITVIAGHNLLDYVAPAKPSPFWLLLHQFGTFNLTPNLVVFAVYPLIPWVAVMAAGYAFGPIVQADAAKRRQSILYTGLALTGLFIVLRAVNRYGDPLRWSAQSSPAATLLSFLNCEKYPPSLLFLCMTLGPALLLLRRAETFKGKASSILVTFGRVPFFFYVAHLFLLHLVAIAWALFHDGNAAWLVHGLPPQSKPPGYGFGLPMIYLLWLSAVAALYLPCAWFAQLKQRRRDWWLSYL